MIAQMEDRPPYVTFSYEDVEDRDESIAKGYYCAKQVAFAHVTPKGTAGGKDTFSGNAEEWLARKRSEAMSGIIPQAWYDAFAAAFAAWQKQEELPVNGVPIKTWPVLSPKERSMCLAANILTVEDLAGLTEQGLAFLGIGARLLKEKAQAWLASAENHGKVALQMTALQAELADTKALLSEAVATIQELKAQIGDDKPRRGRPPKEQEAA